MDARQKRGLKRGLTVYVGVAAVLIALIIAGSIGKANAVCSPSGDTCLNTVKFAKKFHNGFYSHASGIPVHKAFKSPKAARAVFTHKYIAFYKSHPKLRKGLYRHAVHLNNQSKIAERASRNLGSSRNQCFFPLTQTCQAALEWVNMIANSECAGWHSYPSLFDHAACDRFEKPTSHQEFLTKGELQRGLVIGGCTVGSGVAIVVAVGSGGGAAPLLAAGAASTGCVGTIWMIASP